MRTFILISLLAISIQSKAQQSIWLLEPIVDSIDEKNLILDRFPILSNGKYGYYAKHKGIIVPAIYDEISQIQELYPRMDNAISVFLVRKNSLYGIYVPEAGEILPCDYTHIENADIGTIKVYKGKLFAIYNIEEMKFTTPFPSSQLKSKNDRFKMEIPIEEQLEIGGAASVIGVDEINVRHQEEMRSKVRDSELNGKTLESFLVNNGLPLGYSVATKLSPNLYTVYNALEKKVDLGVFSISKKKLIVEDAYITIHFLNGFLICDENDAVIARDSSNGKIVSLPIKILKLLDQESEYEFSNTSSYIRALYARKQGLYTDRFELLIPFEYDKLILGKHKNIVDCVNENKTSYYNLLRKEFIRGIDSIAYTSEFCKPIIQKKGKFYSYNLTTSSMIELPYKKITGSFMNDSILLVSNKKGEQFIFSLHTLQYLSNGMDALYYPEYRIMNRNMVKKFNRYFQSALNASTVFPYLIAFRENGKNGCMERNGNIIIPASYDSLFIFTERNYNSLYKTYKHYVQVYHGNEIGIYDVMNRTMLNDHISEVKQVLQSTKMENYLYWYKANGLWGYFTIYDNVSGMEPDCDSFRKMGEYYFLFRGKKVRVIEYGAINVANRYWNDTNSFESLDMYWSGRYFRSRNGGKYGLLSYNTSTILPCIYDSIYRQEAENYTVSGLQVLVVKKENSFGFVKDKNHFYPPFGEAFRYGRNYFVWVKQNGKWGILFN